jgi:hypothetical protein
MRMADGEIRGSAAAGVMEHRNQQGRGGQLLNGFVNS